jgi:hypothetical protein
MRGYALFSVRACQNLQESVAATLKGSPSPTHATLYSFATDRASFCSFTTESENLSADGIYDIKHARR